MWMNLSPDVAGKGSTPAHRLSCVNSREVFLRKYKLGRQEFIIISNILNRYRAGETNISIVGEELRVCQQLTGLKDDRFFKIDQDPDQMIYT